MTFDWKTFTADNAWLQAAVEIEAKANFDIQIGGKVPPSPPSFDPAKLAGRFRQVQLVSILYRELESLLEASNLGAGHEAAICAGQRQIWERLQCLTPEQQQYFDALADEHDSQTEHKSYHTELRPIFRAILTPEDWQMITDAATEAIRDRLLQQITERNNVA